MEKVKKLTAIGVVSIMIFAVGLLGGCGKTPELILQEQVDAIAAQVYHWQASGNPTFEELEAALEQVAYLKGRVVLEGESQALLKQLAEFRGAIEAMKDGLIKSVAVANMVEFVFQGWEITMSRAGGIDFILNNPNDNIVFECIANAGRLSIFRGGLLVYVGGSYALPGDVVSWLPFEGSDRQPPLAEQAYISILLRHEENIVGYAVIQINQPMEFVWHAELLVSVIFPQINGVYQNITTEQVSRLIRNLKK